MDALCNYLGGRSEDFKRKENYLYWSTHIAAEKIFLVKPLTFVNRSGEAMIKIKRFYQLAREDFIVLVDDYDLPFGKLRLRPKGSSGGHNGLRSIENHLGSFYPRIRCGIGNEKIKKPLDQFVLDEFTAEEKAKLKGYLEFIAQAVRAFITEGLEEAMNIYNNKTLGT